VSDEAIAHGTDLLVRRKAEFLRFLEPRLGSRADAEDLLQNALLKVVAHETSLRDSEKLVPWFYRILRNLLVDHYRHNAAFHRLKDQVAADAETATEMDEELFQATYPCVKDVAATLRPEYGELIRRVELANEPLHEVARELGITPGNASVRLHRARQALRKGLAAMCGVCVEHACLDCSCRRRGPGLRSPN
jgi:RNA polymerase sigma-70 factor (ECF subfamily)